MSPTSSLVPPPARLGPEFSELREEVRAFVAAGLADGSIVPRVDTWLSGWDEDFTRELGKRGWLGMTLPAEYGGHGRTALERYVVIEELLSAGAPVAAHWVSDRQIGPSLLRFGTEEQRRKLIPGIASGEVYFGIGMSEPDAGSDLAAVRTKAVQVEGGWEITGTKVWTSGAHKAHYFFCLARSGPPEEKPTGRVDRHVGLSQFIIDLRGPGVEIRPIRLLTGAHHFNEVVLEKAFVPDEMVFGNIGDGWHQVTSELAYERSGPERFLSVFQLLAAMVGELNRREVPASDRATLGSLIARIHTLRQLSLSVAGALAAGQHPDVAAALVKDLGTRFEGDVVEAARLLLHVEPDPTADEGIARMLSDSILHMPGFTLRGGTNEVLRGVVARGMGLR